MALIERRILFRAALAGVLVASLALSACGRKGALEPPPKAGVVNGDATMEDGGEAGAAERKSGGRNSTRSFPLDFLI